MTDPLPMPEHVVPLEQVRARLDALDLARPVLRQEEAQAHFLRYLERVGSTAFPDGPPQVHWLMGLHNFSRRRTDLGFDNYPNHQARSRQAVQISAYARDLAHFAHRHSEWVNRLVFFNAIQAARTDAVIDGPYSWQFQNLTDEALLQAVEAGLGYWSFGWRNVLLIPRPAVRLRNEGQQNRGRGWVPHSLLGPAVKFPFDPISDQYWIRGTRVPAFVVTNPERITRQHIRNASTRPVRNAMIDQYGLLRYAIERGFKIIDRNEEFGAILWRRGNKRDAIERECVVELINSTPEPNGEHRHFARRVPAGMMTARQAVAWSFGIDRERDYHPLQQS